MTVDYEASLARQCPVCDEIPSVPCADDDGFADLHLARVVLVL